MSQGAADPWPAISAFCGTGCQVRCDVHGDGHINDTYLLSIGQNGSIVRRILQRLNASVFPQPRLVMENIVAITARIARNAGSGVALRLLPTCDGDPWFVDAQGAHWRCYPCIDGSRTLARVETPAQAHAAASAFARFLAGLDPWDGPRLHEVLPRFHDTPWRLACLRAAAAADTYGRVHEVGEDLAWALGQEQLAGVLQTERAAGRLPERVTHNDTKMSNLMFCADRDEALCVVDLDTLMPGVSLYDFGDLVRTATATAAEDETDLTLVDSDPHLYAALADGWLQGLAGALAPAERNLMPLAGAVITIEQGVRFLTDHLQGDGYFRIHRPGHNRDRARSQFAMARAILRRQCPG